MIYEQSIGAMTTDKGKLNYFKINVFHHHWVCHKHHNPMQYINIYSTKK
jgi:hypothetical protein